ncbi:MAG: DNA ligase [Azonexus sp.]
MSDLNDGESIEIKGSGIKPYLIRNIGGLYSCSCPAWMNQSLAIERRTCKHIRKLRGDAAEAERIGNLPERPVKPAKASEAGDLASTEIADKAPPLLLAHSWDNESDLTDWWMSEKLDGVRAYWDGQQFFSRQGNVYHAPDWFIAKLPPIPLDGELWLDRKSFQRTVSIVRRQDKSDLWQEISYVVFDAPAVPGPFESRLAALAECLQGLPAPVRLLEQSRCQGHEHLRETLREIEAIGGEGLMLRQPGSLYEAGRSTTLYKVKSFHDAEATVIEHLPGTGRHKGRLGALLVALPDGTQFSVGTGFSDAQRENPPLPGSLITFRYQELTDRGVPRFPSFVRIRSDLMPELPAPLASIVAKPAVLTAPLASSRPDGEKEKGRRFEYLDEKSAKFWEICLEDMTVFVNYGRIGSSGQSQQKQFADTDAAARHVEKLIAEKLGKGYCELSGA